MGSLLEKITLYDILGYTFPGCVLLFLLLGTDVKCIFSFLDQWSDYKGAVYVIFFLTAYLCGIILSELADTILAILKKIKSPVSAEWERNAFLNEQVVKALKESGYYDASEAPADEIERSDVSKYMGYMYGSVQKGSEYTRIHDYASAYLLYKNLAMALGIGTGVLFVSKGWNFGILIPGAILIALMVKRSMRFYHIKNKYAVVWFLNKYLCSNQNVS